ncbi:hypothetical [Yersinia pestis KIM10+]|uniref:Uncharacterized protein n=1 Tax=Yersinia pestis TaxID=632 RepID=Q8CKA1_YERPE|nr:hypothetical [Yersinia pestis KIM10+]
MATGYYCMKQLYWYTCGEGDCDLVLLHGWGLNSGGMALHY